MGLERIMLCVIPLGKEGRRFSAAFSGVIQGCRNIMHWIGPLAVLMGIEESVHGNYIGVVVR